MNITQSESLPTDAMQVQWKNITQRTKVKVQTTGPSTQNLPFVDLSGFLVFSKLSHHFGFAHSFQKKGNRSFITSRSHGHPQKLTSLYSSTPQCSLSQNGSVASKIWQVLRPTDENNAANSWTTRDRAFLSLYDLRYRHSTTAHRAQKVSRHLGTVLQHKVKVMPRRVPCYLTGFC